MFSGRILGFVGACVLASATLASALAATPASNSVNIKLSFDIAAGAEAWVANGPGLCRSGTTTAADIPYIQFGDPFKIVMNKELTCDDGTGSIFIELSAGQPGWPSSPTSNGGWIITGGTGDYANAVGGGMFTSRRGSPRDAVGVDQMQGVIVR